MIESLESEFYVTSDFKILAQFFGNHFVYQISHSHGLLLDVFCSISCAFPSITTDPLFQTIFSEYVGGLLSL